jgi:transposase
MALGCKLTTTPTAELQAAGSIEIVKRSDATPGFVVQAKRWIVERTFGWLSRERRSG